MQEQIPQKVKGDLPVAICQLIHQPRRQACQVPLICLQCCKHSLQILHLQAPLPGWEEPLLYQAPLPCIKSMALRCS